MPPSYNPGNSNPFALPAQPGVPGFAAPGLSGAPGASGQQQGHTYYWSPNYYGPGNGAYIPVTADGNHSAAAPILIPAHDANLPQGYQPPR